MKKIVVSLIISFVCLVCNAQKHLEIMNIPIDGDIETFKQMLKEKKGLTLVDSIGRSDIICYEERWFVTSGTYSGETIDQIRILSTPRNKIVYSVVLNIIFDTKFDSELFFKRVINVAEDKYNTSASYGNVGQGFRNKEGEILGARLEFDKGTITVSNPVGPLTGKYHSNKWIVVIAYFDKFNNNSLVELNF